MESTLSNVRRLLWRHGAPTCYLAAANPARARHSDKYTDIRTRRGRTARVWLQRELHELRGSGMKGVILAGGLGTRLYPLTKVTNKHLLPVYDRPMIYWPLQTMVASGVSDILLVCGGNSAGDFLRLLGNGKDFGLKHINYTYQEGEGGIADALSLAEHFADGDPILVMLGDNILEKSLARAVQEFETSPAGAKIFLTEVEHPEWYGVAELDGERVVRLVEKPREPKSNLIAIGAYMYDATAFDFISKLEPSARGELEITDVNNMYIQRGQMRWQKIDGWWADAGESFEMYLKANMLAAGVDPKGMRVPPRQSV
jgi:glucose-1-phosphate thymidylyltransferase